MTDHVTIRAVQLGADEVMTEAALAALVGTGAFAPGGCTITAARVVGGWLELDITGLDVGSSVVTSLSTGRQHIAPAVAPVEPTEWFPA